MSAPWIPIDGAVVCLDCDVLFLDDVCPRCGSEKTTWPLSLWLNRGEYARVARSAR